MHVDIESQPAYRLAAVRHLGPYNQIGRAFGELGRRLGLVTLDSAFEVWHYEQADRYGIGSRIVKVVCIGVGCPRSLRTCGRD